MAIFGHLGLRNPRTDRAEIGTIDYVGHPTPQVKTGLRVYGGRRGENVTSVAFFIFLVPSSPLLSTLRSLA